MLVQTSSWKSNFSVYRDLVNIWYVLNKQIINFLGSIIHLIKSEQFVFFTDVRQKLGGQCVYIVEIQAVEIWHNYRTPAIIIRGLYIFYPIFHCGLYCRAVSVTDNLCTKLGKSSIFEVWNPWFIIESGFKSRAGDKRRMYGK